MTDTPTPDLTAPPLDEVFDTQREVEKNPCGAWQAIQDLSAKLEAAEAKYADAAQKALDHANEYAEMVDRALAAEAFSKILSDELRVQQQEREARTKCAEAAEGEKDAALSVLAKADTLAGCVKPLLDLDEGIGTRSTVHDITAVVLAAYLAARQKGGE